MHRHLLGNVAVEFVLVLCALWFTALRFAVFRLALVLRLAVTLRFAVAALAVLVAAALGLVLSTAAFAFFGIAGFLAGIALVFAGAFLPDAVLRRLQLILAQRRQIDQAVLGAGPGAGGETAP